MAINDALPSEAACAVTYRYFQFCIHLLLLLSTSHFQLFYHAHMKIV